MADRRGGAAVAGTEQGEVTKDLTGTPDDVRPQGLGQLPAGPGAPLAQQFGQPCGYRLPALAIGGRPGRLRLQGGRAVVAKALEGGAGGVRVAAQMAGDAGRRLAGIGEEDHLQAVAGGVGQIGMTQTAEFVARGVVESNVDHVTLYASQAGCLVRIASG